VIKNIGFVSTRIAGTDGVSLEIYKWKQVLERNRYDCFFFAGELGTPKEVSFLAPLAHFNHPEILELHEACFGCTHRSRDLSRRMHEFKDRLKARLYTFIKTFDIDLLIPENALAIPMHIPLGMAITELLAETGMPCVAHHHDFKWERDRFRINCVQDLLQYAFPPVLTNIRHVVINSEASRQLSYRHGISNTVVPNVYDFEHPYEPSPKREELRQELGYGDDDVMLLQPTRIVPRKWVERAVELALLLNPDKPRLVISHEAGDEGDVYVHRVLEFAHRHGVELQLIGDRVDSNSSFSPEHQKEYRIEDVYQAADLVAYPTAYEGFGNAFLETLYFEKPIVVNRYSIFIEDIEPLGFELASFEAFVTQETINRARELMTSPLREEATEKNYKLASKHFSYEVLERKLLPIVNNFR